MKNYCFGNSKSSLQILLYSKFPPLRIHTWGGFGSQLFSAYLVIRLQEIFPGRRLVVVNHTSGVTKRLTEFDFGLLNIESIQIDDFSRSVNRPSSSSDQLAIKFFIYRIATKVVRFVLERLQILNDANNEASLSSIRPWTLSVRGHYTHLLIKKNHIDDLYRKIFVRDSVLNKHQTSCVIHYRLGDLLTLDSKSPIQASRIEKVLEEYHLIHPAPLVLTDSDALQYLEFVSGTKYLYQIQPLNLDAIRTLEICVHSDEFLGTTAKLSLWAAIFRQYVLGKQSYLPKELYWAKSYGLDTCWF